MKIVQLVTNWFAIPEHGEDYETYNIGRDDIVKIVEHRPEGRGDIWFYDIYYKDGRMKRCFNPNSVSFEGAPK